MGLASTRLRAPISRFAQHVFANPRTGEAYTCIKHPWETARRKAGLGDLHIHEFDLFAVGRILGHADHQSTMRYAHLADETLMAAVEAGAAKLNL